MTGYTRQKYDVFSENNDCLKCNLLSVIHESFVISSHRVSILSTIREKKSFYGGVDHRIRNITFTLLRLWTYSSGRSWSGLDVSIMGRWMLFSPGRERKYCRLCINFKIATI